MSWMQDVSTPPEATSMPHPGKELIHRVAGTSDLASFFSSGRQSVQDLEQTLAIVGRSLDSFESILDFGCGCGRMLLWMTDVAKTGELHGTDIDAEAIEWCRANIPYVQLGVNAAEPPLAYPDCAFDLVVNHSVFTHIDERLQDLWLDELQRVTRPGGFLVLSVHGENALHQNDWATRDRLEQEGISFNDGSLPRQFPLPDWYQNTWHAPWYVFEHWGQRFDIRAYIPRAALGYQDHVLLERRPDEAKPRIPIRARPRVPAEAMAEQRVTSALAASRVGRSEPSGSVSRFGTLRRLARRLVLRLMLPYTAHRDRFDDAVAASITDLSRAMDQHASALKELEHSVEQLLVRGERPDRHPR
jgi:SAM-dependent methyltransferase